MTHSSQAPAPTAEAKGPGTGNAGWLARYTDAVMNTFGTPGRVLVRGRGAHVWDADGQEYIDLLAGIAVNCLGHAHPAIIRSVTEQLSELGHVSNFFTTPAQVGLAEELERLADRYRCSTLVVLIRLRDTGLVGREGFQNIYDAEVDRLRKAAERIPRGGGGDFYNNQPFRVGRTLGRAIIRDTMRGSTSMTEALRLLSFKRALMFDKCAILLGLRS